MKRHLRPNWIELVIGIFLIALGVFSFFSPDALLSVIITLYGIFAVITGIEDIVFYVKFTRFTGFGPMISLICGIVSVMCGIMLIAYPEAARWLLTLLFSLWIITHCASRLSHATAFRGPESNFSYYFTLIINILGILLGVAMLLVPRLSAATMQAAGYVVAVALLLLGIENVVLSFADGENSDRFFY